MTVFTKEIPTTATKCVAIMGKGGAGKTSLVRWLVEAGQKVAVIDTDCGCETIKDLEGHENFLHADARTMDGFNTAWKECRELPEEWVIFVDSMTDLLENKAYDLSGGAPKLTLNQYGEVGNAGIKVLLAIKNRTLGHHVMVTVKEEYTQDPEGAMYWAPKLIGQMTGKAFTDKFDAVLRCIVETKGATSRHMLITAPVANSEVKLRVTPAVRETIPAMVPSEEFGDVWRKILGEGG